MVRTHYIGLFGLALFSCLYFGCGKTSQVPGASRHRVAGRFSGGPRAPPQPAAPRQLRACPPGWPPPADLGAWPHACQPYPSTARALHTNNPIFSKGPFCS